MRPRLSSLPQDDLRDVMLHPVQQHVRGRVEELLIDLRSTSSANHFFEFQRILLAEVVAAERAWGEVRRAVSRLRAGRTLPAAAPQLPLGFSPGDRRAWMLEELVRERAVRQLRAVGDALAWKATGYDRRYVLALAGNDAAGPMAAKAGLDVELGAVVDLWERDRNFALLHDLTNCLRIGDLTEFRPDGTREIHEVKRSRGATRAQRRRMQAAVRALNEGEPLPRSGSTLFAVSQPLRTHLDSLGSALAMARSRGVSGVVVPGGRAVMVCNAMAAPAVMGGVPEDWVDVLRRERAAVICRADLDRERHHVNMRTADAAARSPVAVPYGVYPLPPADCADLICDFASAEIVMGVSGLFDAAAREGLAAELLLPGRTEHLSRSQPMFRFRRGDRAVVVHSAVAGQLLGELIDLDVLVPALDELLHLASPPSSPVLAFDDEGKVWR